jgi:hypothetical protein
MKRILPIVIATLTLSVAFAADTHDHKPAAGPSGGRVIEIEGGHAEFFIQPDRKVRVTILDEANKPIAPGGQRITAIAEAPGGKARLTFGRTAEAFVSETALPDGDGYRIVLQIRATESTKPQNTRIDYNPAICEGCKHPEYACTCTGEGHAH